MSLIGELRGFKSEHEVRGWSRAYKVVDENTLRDFIAGQEHPAEASQLLVTATTERRDVLRFGHLVWAQAILDNPMATDAAPDYRPTGRQYTPSEDAGIYFVLRAMSHPEGSENRLRSLAEGIEYDSPICSLQLGLTVLDGAWRERYTAEDAIGLVEMAIKCGVNPAAYGAHLIEGAGVQQDVARGVAMIESVKHLSSTSRRALLVLARAYASGMITGKSDIHAAVGVFIRNAPTWRRMLYRLGVSQAAWLNRELDKTMPASTGLFEA